MIRKEVESNDYNLLNHRFTQEQQEKLKKLAELLEDTFATIRFHYRMCSLSCDLPIGVL